VFVACNARQCRCDARRFAFPPSEHFPDPNLNQNENTATTTKNNSKNPHEFVLLHGDVTEMVDDCQQRFQYNVKTAEGNGPESQPGVRKDLGPILSKENCTCDSSIFMGISKLVGTICNRGILSLVPELNNLTVPLGLFLQ
jgi:hypothetical protein